jgi:hypothetical protein
MTIVKKSMQQKFETAMLAGKVLTQAQLVKIGFANPADAVYKARKKGMAIVRVEKTTRAGTFSTYSLVM